MIVLRGSISLMVNALGRLELWAWNSAYSALVGLLVGVGLSAAFGAVLGHREEHRELEFHTGRDPSHPWMPPVLTCTFLAVVGLQLAPWVAAGLPGGVSHSRFLLAGAFVMTCAAAVALGSRWWLMRLDHTGKGAATAILGLPTVLVFTMTFAVSAPLQGGKGKASRGRGLLGNSAPRPPPARRSKTMSAAAL